MKPARARQVLLEHLAYLQARTAADGGAHSKVFDVMRAIPIVLGIDEAEERHVEQRRVVQQRRIEEHVEKRVTKDEQLRTAIGALRDVAAVDVAGVLARLEKGGMR